MTVHVVIRKDYINSLEDKPVELFVDLRQAIERYNELKEVEEVTMYSTDI